MGVPVCRDAGIITNYISHEPAGKGMDTIAVLADSRKGNTLQVAAAIAGELGTEVGDIKKPLPDAGILFLGSGTYGGRPGFWMSRLISGGVFTGRKVALFATAGTKDGERMLNGIAEALEKKGATILGKDGSRGMAIIVRYRHPRPEDLEAARRWARDIAGK
jgi:flavodoxin I